MIADLLQERRDKRVAKANAATAKANARAEKYRAETAKAEVRIAELEKLLELARKDNAHGDDDE